MIPYFSSAVYSKVLTKDHWITPTTPTLYFLGNVEFTVNRVPCLITRGCCRGRLANGEHGTPSSTVGSPLYVYPVPSRLIGNGPSSTMGGNLMFHVFWI